MRISVLAFVKVLGHRWSPMKHDDRPVQGIDRSITITRTREKPWNIFPLVDEIF